MAKLEAMLEQRGIATAREMSEAIARCQLHGGDLTTSLLQFVSADETLLSAALSECYGLPAAAVGALPVADDGALRSLPRDVAERYCCFPLEASPGRLVLAVAHPLEAALKEELGATLGVLIEERVALEVRIRQALARHYGSPLSARNQRGIARLEGDFEAVGHETPLGMWSDAQLTALPRPPSELPPSHRDSRPPSMRARARAEGQRFGTSSAPPSPPPKASRRREPLTLARAREELARASTRNDVLDIFFGFASQFFEYSALFAVHNALAEGLDAWGKGADRETVLGIGVPLDLPSSLSEAAESCKVRLTRLGKEGIDRTLCFDLGRQFNAKVLLLPVSLRGRCAVLLYADNGELDVLERDIADLIVLAPDVANALGRIILQRKKEARSRSVDPPDAALARRSQPAPAQHDARAAPASGEPASNGRNGAPLSAPSSRDGVQPQLVVAIGPDTNHVTRARSGSAPPGPASQRMNAEPVSGEDPVFLLARPQTKPADGVRAEGIVGGAAAPSSRHSSPQPALPYATRVEKPLVSITVPVRLTASRPRLPSVIVDPESADPEASEKATRAAAITRAPSQARSTGSGRRPYVPPPAAAPRRSVEDASDPRQAITSPPAARAAEARVAEARAKSASAETAIVHASEAPTSGSADQWSAVRAHGGALMPPAVSEVDPDSLEDIGGDPTPSSDVWPPPIMDHSPPPQQPPLTALVPIIIADPPKNRRGVINARGAARTNVRRAGPSAPPSGPHGGTSPTVPSPARARAQEASLSAASLGQASMQTLPSAVDIGTAQTRLREAETIPAARRDDSVQQRGPARDEDAVRVGEHAASTAWTNGAAPLAPATPATITAPSAGTSSSLAARDLDTSASDAGRAPRERDGDRDADAGSGSEQATQPDAVRADSPEPVASELDHESVVRHGAIVEPSAEPAAPDAPPRPPVPSVRSAPLPSRTRTLQTMPAVPGGRHAPAMPPRASTSRADLAAPSAGSGGSAPSHTLPEAGAAASPAAAAPPSGIERAAANSGQGSTAATTASPPVSGTSGVASGARPAGTSAALAASATTLPVRGAAPAERRSWPPPAAPQTAPRPAGPLRAGLPGAAATAGELPPSVVHGAASSAAATPGAAASAGAESASSSRATPASGAAANVSGAAPAHPGAAAHLPEGAAALQREVPRAASPSSDPASARGAPWQPASAPSAAAPGSAAPTSPAAAPSATGAGAGRPANPANAARSVIPASPTATSPAATSATTAGMAAAAAAAAQAGAASTTSRSPGITLIPGSRTPGTTTPGMTAVSAAPAAWRPAAWAAPRPATAPSQAAPSATPSLDVPRTAQQRSTGSAPLPASAPAATDTAAGERPAIFPPPPSEIDEIVDSVCQGDPRAVQDLARIGAPSLPQVMARFPGPVISERPSSRASECGPLLRALAAIGSPAMPSITKCSEDGDARVRRWATLLLGEMPSLEACRAVVQRLADDEPRVHQAALDAARLLLSGPAAEAFRDTLFEVAEADDAPLTLRLRTLEHVAKLKDSASVPRLVAFLAADLEPIVHKALWALSVVTRHDFGRDARAWTEFWNQNRERHRIEWLIDALDPSYPRSSKAAADELREEAGELFGYAEEQSPAERREVQDKFRTWWQSGSARRRSSSPRA